MRILVIEDNAAIRQLLARCLYNIGCDAVCAPSAVEGVQTAKQSKDFDLYLIDINLPDISGLHAGLSLYHLMKNEKLLTSPIVAVTAQSDSVTRERAMRFGFSAFLVKPFTEQQISNLVQHYKKV